MSASLPVSCGDEKPVAANQQHLFDIQNCNPHVTITSLSQDRLLHFLCLQMTLPYQSFTSFPKVTGTSHRWLGSLFLLVYSCQFASLLFFFFGNVDSHHRSSVFSLGLLFSGIQNPETPKRKLFVGQWQLRNRLRYLFRTFSHIFKEESNLP